MYEIIAAVRGSGFFSIGFCAIYPPKGSTYTKTYIRTYTKKAGKNLQRLAQSLIEEPRAKAQFSWNDKDLTRKMKSRTRDSARPKFPDTRR